MVCDTSASRDVSIQQIWEYSFKKCRRYAPDTIIVEIRSKSQNWYMTLCHPKMQPHTKFGIPTWNRKKCSNMIIIKKNWVRGQGHSDSKLVFDTWPSQDAFTHQIWNSYLKEYRSYAPDSMPILETRSKVKVTVTGIWNGTICHSKMHSYTKLWIPISNNKRVMLRIVLLKKRGKMSSLRSQWPVNGTLHTTILRCIHTPTLKFPIYSRDMFWTRIFYKLGQRPRSKWPENGMWHSAIQSGIHTPNLGFLPSII